MTTQQSLFCIFPYIEIHEPMTIWGETLFPISAIDDVNMSDENKEHFLKLSQMFFLYSDDQPVKDVTCITLSTPYDDKREFDFKNKLEELRKIFDYLACVPDQSPHKSWLFRNYEQVDYYLFTVKTDIWKSIIRCIQTDNFPKEEKSYEGYFYELNQFDDGYVIEGCRIYPRTNKIFDSLDLSRMFAHHRIFESNSNPLSQYIYNDNSSNLNTRILTSLEWYNRSCLQSITSDLSLVALATAFETLFSFEREMNKTDLLIHSIQMILGDISRLGEWGKQFYNARSRILHEGKWEQDKFILSKDKSSPSQYGSLTHFGWLIYRICFEAILTGSIKASRSNLKAQFFNNQERLEKIIMTLKEEKNPFIALTAVINDVEMLDNYTYFDPNPITYKTVWEGCLLLVEIFLKTEEKITEEQQEVMQKIVSGVEISNIPLKEKIVEHIILVLQSTTEFPRNVIENAQADLRNPKISLHEIQKKIGQLLADTRNNHISNEIRDRLQSIVTIIDNTQYNATFDLIASVIEKDGNRGIDKKRLFSIVEAYSTFAEHISRTFRIDLHSYLSWFKETSND